MCKIGFRSVGLYGLGIILSPSISETISTEGVIEFKKPPSLILSATLPWLVMAMPPNPGLQRGNLPLENRMTLSPASALCDQQALLLHFSRRKVCTQFQMTGICSEFALSLLVPSFVRMT